MFFIGILPDRTYSVRQAARYLGIHRCTIYTYIKLPDKPLPYLRHLHNDRMFFIGADLIAYKAGGFPKRGRKRKDRKP